MHCTDINVVLKSFLPLSYFTGLVPYNLFLSAEAGAVHAEEEPALVVDGLGGRGQDLPQVDRDRARLQSEGHS